MVNINGTHKVFPSPWNNGDKLAPSSVELDGSDRNYVLAFEMFAVMRNWMFFYASYITADLWAHFHSPLRDCGLEGVAAFSVSKAHPLGRQLDRHGILKMMRDPWYHGGDIADQLVQYAEAVQAEFLCLVAPEAEHLAEHAGWPHRHRCGVLRATLGLRRGEMPTCWYNAYRHFYSDGGLDWPYR